MMENRIRFTKMHGAGNDYVYIDCTNGILPENIGELAVKISDRHFGVGSDGLVLICKSDVADFKMRMFNADGSEAQMCGNASRCIGKFVYDKGLTNKTEITLETLAGIKYLKLFVKNAIVEKVRVDMGEPILEAEKIPVYPINLPEIGINSQIINELRDFNGHEFHITAVSMGNPHCVIFVDDVENFDVHGIGKIIENSRDVFPERSNVEFVEVLDRQKLKMRVWERGAGETWACGTGASAVLVAAVLNDKSDRKATLQLLGGDLEIEWASNNHVLMTGEATTVFEGEYFLNMETVAPERFPVIDAAGGIVVNAKNEVLLIFRRGFWDLPKGKKETGECFEECALREVKEEIGIQNLKIVKKIGDTQHFMLNNGEKYIKNTAWYLMTTNFSGKLVPQTEEDIEIAAWFDKSNIMALKPMYTNIREILEKSKI